MQVVNVPTGDTRDYLVPSIEVASCPAAILFLTTAAYLFCLLSHRLIGLVL